MRYIEITIVWFGVLMASIYWGRSDEAYGLGIVAVWVLATLVYIWVMIKTWRSPPKR
ncbi:MAG: hypothetical protein KIH44_001195 [Octadecabacter sp.]|nr:hypothetical protein [Octadecabacter sp.]